MRVLLIGGNGQLGKSILDSGLSADLEIFSPSSSVLDLKETKKIDDYFSNIKPEVIINAAAFTNVDLSEENKNEAKLINTDGPKYLAEKTEKEGAFLIQVSTDYVFGANSSGPFSSTDIVDPINYYGKTKAEAEAEIKKITNNYLIIRTASLVSEYGNNFVGTIVSRLLQKDNLRIIKNQYISMTYARYLSQGILKIIKMHQANNLKKLTNNNIIHFTNNGYTTWYEIAIKIQDFLKSKNIIDNKDYITPILESEWQSSAKRPIDSRLLLNKNVYSNLKIELINWNEPLKDLIEKYI